MSVDLDRELRAVLLEIADVAPPVGVAAAAIRTGRRRRLGAISAAAAGVAVVATLALTVPSLLRPPTPAASYTPSHVVLAYGFHDQSTWWADSWSVLDPQSGTYERLSYHTVVPSPDGKWLLVAEGYGFDRFGILDRATDEVSWLPGVRTGAANARWAPDGSTLLFTESPLDEYPSPLSFSLVDPRTLVETRVPTAATNHTDLALAFSFAADGRSVLLVRGMTVMDSPTRGHTRFTSVDRYTLDGDLIGSTPWTVEAAEWAVFSEDRTEVAAWVPRGDGAYSVLISSLANGSTVATIDAGTYGSLTYVDDEIVVVGRTVLSRSGDVLGQVPEAPAGTQSFPSFDTALIGPAAGLPPAVAPLIF